MLSLKEEIAAASVAINNIMAGVFDWLLFKLEYSNNNNNKRPFSHSFGNRYLTKVPGVSFAWYGTLLIQRKAPTGITSKGKSQGSNTFAKVSFVWRLGSYTLSKESHHLSILFEATRR